MMECARFLMRLPYLRWRAAHAQEAYLVEWLL